MTSDITPDTILGDIAAAVPASLAVFERLGLDYCCGGKRPLKDAAADAGLDPEEVLRRIDEAVAAENAADERDWRAATMAELADHIEATHHAFVRDALARLAETLPRVVRAHGRTHPELHELAGVVETFAEEMRDHMVREERVVFPWLRRLEKRSEIQGGPPWSVRRPISCMIHDHDDAGEALATMRRLTSGYTPPEGACPTYRSMLRTLETLEADTHRHIHKENNILFPAGVAAEDAIKAEASKRAAAG
jgi:regulator of cell morphogenesis and NO signaling